MFMTYFPRFEGLIESTWSSKAKSRSTPRLRRRQVVGLAETNSLLATQLTTDVKLSVDVTRTPEVLPNGNLKVLLEVNKI